MGTVAPETPPPANQPTAEHYEEELTLPTLPPAPVTLDFKGPGLFGPETGLGRSKHQLGLYLLSQKLKNQKYLYKFVCLIVCLFCIRIKTPPSLCAGMPTCLLCVCIRGSVYCDDMGLDQIPPLPKDTTHLYGRFNKIRHVKNTDFINLSEDSLWTQLL